MRPACSCPSCVFLAQLPPVERLDNPVVYDQKHRSYSTTDPGVIVEASIENIETACGIPSLMQGYNNEDIARGIDEHMFREPLGVVAAITPFNFPGMIPFWFMPYALATGNCFILKPSDRAPITSNKVFELMATLPGKRLAGVWDLLGDGRNKEAGTGGASMPG